MIRGNGAISFGTAWGIGQFDINRLIDTAEIIGGLPFVQLQFVINYKNNPWNAKGSVTY